MTLKEPAISNYSEEMVRTGKLIVGQIVYEMVKHSPERNESIFILNLGLVFNAIRVGIIDLISGYAQGLGGMFYMILEPNIRKTYEQFKLQAEREEAKSAQDFKDEEELLKMIGETAQKDRNNYEPFEHSQLYFPKGK